MDLACSSWYWSGAAGLLTPNCQTASSCAADQHGQFGLLLLGACCYALAVALSGIKWGILLASVGLRPPTPRLLGHQWLAEFSTTFCPAKWVATSCAAMLWRQTRTRMPRPRQRTHRSLYRAHGFMSAASVASIIMLLGAPARWHAICRRRAALHSPIAVGVVGLTLLLAATVGAVLSRRIKQLVERVLQHLPFAQHTTPIWRPLAAAFNAYRHQYRAMWLTALCGLLIVFLPASTFGSLPRPSSPAAFRCWPS
ncbi:MAG: flippase-like domain-containing protein [Caldilineaceae bacterium]|nr:flippase-like domain-containing protein [Caldilineaceae bacterium]